MKIKITDKLTAIGRGIFVDEKGKTIIQDVNRLHSGKVVPGDLKNMLLLLQNRYMFSAIIGLLAGFVTGWWLLAVLIASLLLFLSEAYYRYVFLPQCDVVEGIRFPYGSSLKDQYLQENRFQNIYKLVISFLFPCILLYYVIVNIRNSDIRSNQNMQVMIFYFLIIACYSVYMFIESIRALLIQQKRKKEGLKR